MQNAELAPAILSTYKDYEEIGEQSLLDQLFSSSQNLRDTISNDGLSKLTRLYPRFAKEIETNADIAEKLLECSTWLVKIMQIRFVKFRSIFTVRSN